MQSTDTLHLKSLLVASPRFLASMNLVRRLQLLVYRSSTDGSAEAELPPDEIIFAPENLKAFEQTLHHWERTVHHRREQEGDS